MAASSAYIGSVMVLKRMSLVGDALSHVALPGMALAIAINLSPILGAFIALTIAVLGIWYLETKSNSYPEAIVGLFFTASLALGILITDEPELLEALFGSIEKINFYEGIATILISLLIIIITYLIYPKLTVILISDELAKSVGINTRSVNLVYLLVVGAVVALGIRFVGTLLTGALVIIPAVSARNMVRSMKGYSLTSVLFGVVSAFLGIIIATTKGFLIGPSVVLVSVAIFIISYIYKAIFVEA